MPTEWNRGGGGSGGSAGTGDVVGPAAATDNALARFDGVTGKLIQNGVLTEADYTGVLSGPIAATHTSIVGGGFTNQPAGGTITLVSSDNGDAGVQVTILAELAGADAGENITLTGTIPIVSGGSYTKILALVVTGGVPVGTITATKTAGGGTITTIIPPATSAGLETFAAVNCFGRDINIVASGATTKEIGIGGYAPGGAVQRKPVTLTGTTTVQSGVTWDSVVQVYVGDLEVTRTITITSIGGFNFPNPVVDNSVPRFDGTVGNLLQTSAASVSDGGYLLDVGRARLAAQFDKTNDSTLANITGLSLNLEAGKTYAFTARLHTALDAAGQGQAAVAGTATAAGGDIIGNSVAFDSGSSGAVVAGVQWVLLGAGSRVDITASTGTVYIEINGTITTATAGTLTVQFAQETATLATTSSVLKGSTFTAIEIP